MSETQKSGNGLSVTGPGGFTMYYIHAKTTND